MSVFLSNVCYDVSTNTYSFTFLHTRTVHLDIIRVPRQAELALGVPGRLKPRIFSTFGTTRVVGLQPHAPTTFTQGEIPGTHFQRLSRPQGT
jgi:hypothetical protein